MYLPSLIFETMTIKRSLCEHKGVLKFIIRHLYPCEMKKETRRHNSLQTLLKRGSKTIAPLTSYDPKFWSDFHSLRHKLQRVQ